MRKGVWQPDMRIGTPNARFTDQTKHVTGESEMENMKPCGSPTDWVIPLFMRYEHCAQK